MSWFVVTARQQIVLKHVEDVDQRQSHRYLRIVNKIYQCAVYGNLKDKGFEPYLPCYRKTFYKGRHKYWEPEPLFGRYIFVEFNERWPDAREVPGICSVLKACATDELPSTIKDDVIAEWKAKEKDGFVVRLQAGQPVRARNGIFAYQVGRFVGLSNREHDIALFEFLGQPIRVEFQQRGVLVPA